MVMSHSSIVKRVKMDVKYVIRHKSSNVIAVYKNIFYNLTVPAHHVQKAATTAPHSRSATPAKPIKDILKTILHFMEHHTV